jgi:type II secretory pathway pseudopilin PulG
MKLKITKRSKGMTLLELTVVILVLLSLITILFVGARAWKKGSDRSANIMNIRNCQLAMRGYENMYQKKAGDDFDQDMLEEYVKMPEPPNTEFLTYTAGATITEVGDLWLGVLDTSDGEDYTPEEAVTADW